MAKFRVWYGDEPTYKKVSSLTEAIKFIKKKPEFDESNSGIEEKIDDEYWDEWLDDDDQNVHEHLYMYGGKSKFLRSLEDDEDEDLDEDEEDLDEDDEDLEDEEDAVEEDLDDRLMDVIGGGRSPATEVEETFDDEDDEDLDDDEDDDLDDLDDEDDEDL